VVIFSHGIGEDRDSYAWLGRALAEHGYVAVHVTHAGTDKAMLRRGWWQLYKATQQRENWIRRPRDVSAVIDELAKRDDVDMSRIAVAGHSAGAFTALAIAGMQAGSGESFRDPRVKAAVAMSMPKLGDVIPPGGYDTIAIPVLHMTGTRDWSLVWRTLPRDRRIPFERTHATRQYLVTLRGVGHNTFSNENEPAHALMARLVIDFLDAELNGRDWSPRDLPRDAKLERK
jgi:predicted dienelactone hydrolase